MQPLFVSNFDTRDTAKDLGHMFSKYGKVICLL